MQRLGWLGLVASVALFGVACSSDDGATGGEAGSAAAGSSSSAGTANGGAAGDLNGGSGGAGAGQAGGTGGSAGAASGGSAGAASGGSGGAISGSASLEGRIGRTARIPSGLDGIGNVYIAVFADNPVTNMNAEALANTLIMDADLSVDGTSVSYRVDNIPVSSEPRFVVAFMDDDGNVSQADPSPKKPDLIAFDGLSPISVTLATPGVTELDLVLNAEIPF
ncbi:MAG: hypothetical protein R3B89_21695 [Polyangiaceae bacterium]